MAPRRVHAVLKERAKDRGIDHGPILGRRALVLLANQIELKTVQLDGLDLGKKAAIEVADPLEPAPLGRLGVVHLTEKASEQIIRCLAIKDAVVVDRQDGGCGHEVDVFREHRHKKLQNEPLGLLAWNRMFRTLDQAPEQFSHPIGGLARHLLAIVSEHGFGVGGKQEV